MRFLFPEAGSGVSTLATLRRGSFRYSSLVGGMHGPSVQRMTFGPLRILPVTGG